MCDFAIIEKDVLYWAHDRKIIDFDNYRQMHLQVLRTQCLKLTEEVGELAQAIYDNSVIHNYSEAAIVDAIGDSLVVMTSLVWALPDQCRETTRLLDLYKYAMGMEYESYPKAHLLLASALGETASAIIKNKPSCEIKHGLQRLMLFICACAHNNNLYVVDCYKAAYETIKNRKGKTTVDGNFIKEGD